MVPSSAAALRLDQVERRRAGRLSLARGPVEAFAAEQASLCELMGYVLACEKPSQAEPARRIVEQLIADRREARDILEQLKAAERAMLRLWLMRLEQPEEPA
jgi:hypothetical protein